MVNGVIVPSDGVLEEDIVSGYVSVKRDGNTVMLNIIDHSITDGAAGFTIPAIYRPSGERICTVLCYHGSTSPSHVIGYADISSTGSISFVEPLNNTYVRPTCKIYGSLMWII